MLLCGVSVFCLLCGRLIYCNVEIDSGSGAIFILLFPFFTVLLFNMRYPDMAAVQRKLLAETCGLPISLFCSATNNSAINIRI